MTEEEKEDSRRMGLKIKADYNAQGGEMLNLIPLDNAINSGRWNSVNKEIVKLTTIVTSGKRKKQ